MGLNDIELKKTAILFFDILNGYYHAAEGAAKERMKPMVENLRGRESFLERVGSDENIQAGLRQEWCRPSARSEQIASPEALTKFGCGKDEDPVLGAATPAFKADDHARADPGWARARWGQTFHSKQSWQRDAIRLLVA